MIRLALFDIDGTLIRTGGAGVAAFARTGETLFGIQNGVARMRFAGRTDTSLIRELLARHDISPTPENRARFQEHYLALLPRVLGQYPGRVCPGVREFVTALQALPHPPVLGLLTGNLRAGAEIKLRHFGLWDIFAAVGAFGDDDEDRNRIAAVALARGRALLGNDLAPEEVLVVGDTPHDVACGRAVGARVLAVATGGAGWEELAATRPDWLAPDLTRVSVEEISGPGH